MAKEIEEVKEDLDFEKYRKEFIRHEHEHEVNERKRRYIGLFGRTGIGKTALLNSLLNPFYAYVRLTRQLKWYPDGNIEKAGRHTLERVTAEFTGNISVIDNCGLDDLTTDGIQPELEAQIDVGEAVGLKHYQQNRKMAKQKREEKRKRDKQEQSNYRQIVKTAAGNMKMVGQLLLIVLYVLRYNVAGGQVITDQNAVLIKGFEASLQCSFRGTPLQLYWIKMGGPSMSEAEPLIGWENGRTQRPTHDSGKFNLSQNFSLTFTADIGDAGRYHCDVSNDERIKIWGYTDVIVAVPPSDPFPMIDNFTISDGNQRTPITCRADGASIGLVDLQWMHNGDPYPQINRTFTNTDGTTENLTATIEAQVSEEPYICVGTMKASKRVNSTDEALVQRTLISTIPSEEPTEQLTTPIEVTDNNDSSVIAVVLSGSILLALTVIATAYICVKKNSPVCQLWLYKPYTMEGRQQGGPKATLLQGVNNVGSQRDTSVILRTPRNQ